MKKRIIIISIISFFIICILSVLTVFLIMRFSKKDNNQNQSNTIVFDYDDYKYKTSTLKTPTDGTNPSDYSALENLYYAFYNLENKKSYKMEEVGTTTAQVLFIKQEQKILKSKTIIDDEALLTTISSGILNVCYQTYFKEYGNTIHQRKTDKVNDLKPTFEEESSKIEIKEYKDKFGLLPYKASPYIICDDTIINYSELKFENDLFQVSIELNTDDAKAPYWFKNEIMTLGDAKIPEFILINIIYKFDKNWNIIEVETKEKYKVENSYSLGMKVECETHYIDRYEYENVSFDEKYYNYFKKIDK